MKNLVLILFTLLYIQGFSQKNYGLKFWLNRYKVQAPLAVALGFLDATSEVMFYNYGLFDSAWGGITNDNYWNPRLSSSRKWKNGDYMQGEAFFLSSTALSWTVEGRKLVRMGNRIIWGLQALGPTYNSLRASPATQTGQGILLSMSVAPFTEEKMFPEKWWVYAVDFAINFGVQSLAFEITNRWYRSNL